MLYICFHKNMSKGSRVTKQTQFPKRKISRGHTSIKNVGKVIVLVLCTSSNDTLYLYQVSGKHFKGFQSY